MEHGNFSKRDIQKALTFCQYYKKLGLVRIPINEDSNIQSALDSGCNGLIFPRIENKIDAQNCVKKCLFPPRGKRGFNPFTRYNFYNLNNKKVNKNILKIIMIETKKGMENIEEIISVNGIDIIYFGIFDLSMEYNLNTNDKRLTKIIENGIKKCKKNKVEVGLMDLDRKSQKLSKKFNIKFLLKDVDTNLFAQIAKKSSSLK